MKKKSNKLLAILLIVALMLCTLTLFACNPPSDDEDVEIPTASTATGAVSNGTFSSATTTETTYVPYVLNNVTGWTKTSGANASDTNYIDYGAVNLSDRTAFDENKSTVYTDWTYPGVDPNTEKDASGNYIDTNALLLANTIDGGGSLYYKSSAVTLEKGKHYKLTLDVWTQILATDDTNLQGVWLQINTGAYAEFRCINTKEQWEQYTLYIEANNSENRTIYIQLWLGYGTAYTGTTSSTKAANPRMTQGIALFDNVVLSTITEDAFDAQYTSADLGAGRDYNVIDCIKDANGNNGKVGAVSLLYTDANFSYPTAYSTSSSFSTSYKAYFTAKVGTPNTNAYTSVLGDDADDFDSTGFTSSNYSSNYSNVGLFDLSKLFTPVYAEDNTTITGYTSTYSAINNTFIAPASTYDATTKTYTYSKADVEAFLAAFNERTDAPKESTALMIFHPSETVSGYGYKTAKTFTVEKDSYYKISVWVYVWVPEFSEVAPVFTDYWKTGVDYYNSAYDIDNAPAAVTKPDESEPDYAELLKAYNTYVKYTALKTDFDNDTEEYNQRKEYYNKTAKATFELSGASIDDGTLRTQTSGATGTWEQLTFYVKGNGLSSSALTFEYWYGKGDWESDTLMPGGAIFDNVSITKYNNNADQQAAATADGKTVSTINPLTTENFVAGLSQEATVPYAKFDATSAWDFSYEDSTSKNNAGEAGIISAQTAIDAADATSANHAAAALIFGDYASPNTFSFDGKNFDLVMLRNNLYTSTILKYQPATLFKAQRNSWYRVSMWIYTDGIDKDLGLTIALYDADDNSLTSLSKINPGEDSGEWTEVSFYVQGSPEKDKEFYIQFNLGSGNNLTPDSLVKGAAYITAITYSKIAFSEFDGVTTGTYTASYTIASDLTASDTLSNGWFNSLDEDNYDGTVESDKVFDETGALNGVAVPANWTNGTSYALTAPSTPTISSGVLNWTAKDDNATAYWIYADNYKIGDKNYDNVFLAEVTGATSWTITNATENCSFKVRAVSTAATGVLGYSAFTSAKTNTAGALGTAFETTENVEKYMPVSGIINYKEYMGVDYSGIYGDLSSVDGLHYVSSYDNLLMVSSDTPAITGYTSAASGSLTANSYYMLSVWVMTEPGTKASVTIKNTSKVIDVKTYEGDPAGDYIGYVNIDTNGKWVKYVFYIKTTPMVSAAGFSLELYLGNKYTTTKLTNSSAETDYLNGASTGRVFFDDIYFAAMDSADTYNKYVYGTADVEGWTDADYENSQKTENELAVLKDELGAITGNAYINQYIYKILDLTTDSFDNSTAATAPIGNTPSSYSHYLDTDNGTDYDDDDKNSQAMLYGVYNKNTAYDNIEDVWSESGTALAALLTENGLDIQTLLGFSYANNETVDCGDNYLMMLNLVKNNQYYSSSSSFSLTAGTCYKITFWARAILDSACKAEVRLSYTEDEEDAWQTVNIDSADWKQYTLYLYNSKSTDAVSANLAIYLGYTYTYKNDAGQDVEVNATGIGALIVDNVRFEIAGTSTTAIEDFETVNTAYSALTADQKLTAGYTAYKFVDAEADDSGEDDGDDETDTPVNSQAWLLASSIIIGVVLLATVIVLIVRHFKKRIKKSIPVKVLSNVPVNMQTKEQRKSKTTEVKTDIDNDEFKD